MLGPGRVCRGLPRSLPSLATPTGALLLIHKNAKTEPIFAIPRQRTPSADLPDGGEQVADLDWLLHIAGGSE